MDTKTIAFLVVGIVVGAAVGIGVGFMVWNDDDNEIRTEYWFYLDDGKDTNSITGWYSAISDNPLDGFKSALDNAGIEYVVDTSWGSAYVTEINGMGSEEVPADSDNWVYWTLGVMSGLSSLTWEYSNDGLDSCVTTIYAFIYGDGSMATTNNDWKTTGPFAEA